MASWSGKKLEDFRCDIFLSGMSSKFVESNWRLASRCTQKIDDQIVLRHFVLALDDGREIWCSSTELIVLGKFPQTCFPLAPDSPDEEFSAFRTGVQKGNHLILWSESTEVSTMVWHLKLFPDVKIASQLRIPSTFDACISIDERWLACRSHLLPFVCEVTRRELDRPEVTQGRLEVRDVLGSMIAAVEPGGGVWIITSSETSGTQSAAVISLERKLFYWPPRNDNSFLVHCPPQTACWSWIALLPRNENVTILVCRLSKKCDRGEDLVDHDQYGIYECHQGVIGPLLKTVRGSDWRFQYFQMTQFSDVLDLLEISTEPHCAALSELIGDSDLICAVCWNPSKTQISVVWLDPTTDLFLRVALDVARAADSLTLACAARLARGSNFCALNGLLTPELFALVRNFARAGTLLKS